MRLYRFHVLTLAITFIISSLCPSEATTKKCTQWVAKIVSIEGSIQLRRAQESQWQTAKLNDTLCPGDMLRAPERSRAALFLINEATLRLDQNTTISFSSVEREKTSLIDVLNGIVHFFSRVPRTLKVSTPFVNGSVEGTEFLVEVEANRTSMTVFEGHVALANEAGSLTLAKGQSAVTEKGKAPVIIARVRPRDAVQWALYYPLIFYAARNDWQAKASSLLAVGRVDEAKRDIDEVLRIEPKNGNALALLAVIAVVQNDKEKALSLAQNAVEVDPQSSAARIALSYVLQANFNLDGALENLKEAVKLDPQNALVWARLSEVWLTLGNLDEALNAANEAVALNPDIARTQTVLGYAYLKQIKTKSSGEAFEKAIKLDQGDPLPRLGLGLAKIRDGKLDAGRAEIEIAASLDPNESIIRSYLGKAFYEEKREEKASSQYGTAKELDPLDPTPFFYDAILKQSMNRPVEALQDIQEAIVRNDNRAVYRSRLLLDSDLAARSASLARIYYDLGFEQVAVVEGTKSTNTDPSNFSAHRFLSDTYAALPRHEIARVSELLQSQVLQPINISPIQPSLGEADLFILRSAGPSDPGFREYNPLFNRNRLTLQLSGVGGSNNTFGEEVILSGIHNRLSFSLGQFHYETDGYRTNNDLKQDIYDVFAQYSFTEKTSLQAEFRYRDKDNGDLRLNFFPEDFSPDFRENEDNKSFRVGLHHTFTPGSELIASFIYQSAKTETHEMFVPIDTPPNALDQKTDEDSYSGEIQHIFRRDHFNLITGAGFYETDIKDDSEVTVLLPFPLSPFEISETQRNNVNHINFYLYSQSNYPENVILTVGASTDFYNGELVDRDQFNPKLGLTWNPLPSTTLRAALFRTLKRMLVTNQTLEPTQVAGFNQFFDDADGTEAWVFGTAIDQKFSQKVYGGIEYYQRDLKVPAQITFQPPPPGLPSVTVDQIDWKEYEARAYLYWTPHPWFALSTEYLFEKLDRGSKLVSGIENVKTHRFPFGITFFHPSGFGASLKATYVDQSGMFQPRSVFVESSVAPTATSISGSDSFWIVDASMSYRLPKRWGIISIVAKNILDKSFRFQDTDPVSPMIQPERSVYFKFTVTL